MHGIASVDPLCDLQWPYCSTGGVFLHTTAARATSTACYRATCASRAGVERRYRHIEHRSQIHSTHPGRYDTSADPSG